MHGNRIILLVRISKKEQQDFFMHFKYSCVKNIENNNNSTNFNEELPM
jgi:hypothetical protein